MFTIKSRGVYMSVPQPTFPEDFEELDFSIEEEGWNEYELADNSRIRGRIILNKVVRNPNNPNEIAFITQPPIFVTYAPASSRGDRNNPPQPHEYNTLPNYEIRINRNDERWNRYRILRTGQILRLRLMVTDIRRITNRFGNDSLPFYLVSSGPSIVINPSTNGLQP
jgi:hypothetical protein